MNWWQVLGGTGLLLAATGYFLHGFWQVWQEDSRFQANIISFSRLTAKNGRSGLQGVTYTVTTPIHWLSVKQHRVTSSTHNIPVEQKEWVPTATEYRATPVRETTEDFQDQDGNWQTKIRREHLFENYEHGHWQSRTTQKKVTTVKSSWQLLGNFWPSDFLRLKGYLIYPIFSYPPTEQQEIAAVTTANPDTVSLCWPTIDPNVLSASLMKSSKTWSRCLRQEELGTSGYTYYDLYTSDCDRFRYTEHTLPVGTQIFLAGQIGKGEDFPCAFPNLFQVSATASSAKDLGNEVFGSAYFINIVPLFFIVMLSMLWVMMCL